MSRGVRALTSQILIRRNIAARRQTQCTGVKVLKTSSPYYATNNLW